MKYKQACDFLFGLIDYERKNEAPNLDLKSFEDFLGRVGSPHKRLNHPILVAGTKGKGSTAAFISSCLHTAGYRTGLLTSPHLVNPRERIKIDSRPISKREFAGLVGELRSFISEENRSFRTLFEILTAMAFIHFVRRKTDAVVLEVGMGGRLDATNVVSPVLSVITSISLDHTDILGNTLNEIALEKSGIIRQGGTALSAPQPEEVLDVLQDVALRRKSGLCLSTGRGRVLSRSHRRQEFEYAGERFVIPLLGEHQIENGVLAIDAIRILNQRGFHVESKHVKTGLKRVEWPGRMQILGTSPLVVVDGAHNGESALALKQGVIDYLTYDRLVLILGISRNKNLRSIVEPLSGIADSVIFTRAALPRAQSPEELLSVYRGNAPAHVEANIKSALRRALSLAGKRDLILITGSLYLVGEVLALPKRFLRPKIFSLRRVL
jgi:dihydrofolate synthase/folylpolyglutamate synthase